MNAIRHRFNDLDALRERLYADFGKFPTVVGYPQYADDESDDMVAIIFYHGPQHISTWVEDKEQGWVFESAYSGPEG